MALIDKMRIFVGTEKTDEQIEDLFIKVSAAQANGVRINKAIDSALSTIHIQDNKPPESPRKRDDNVVDYLITRHKLILLELRALGYGYVKIAKYLRQRKIYNKKTNKAFSPSTIRNVFAVLEKRRD